MPWLAVAAAVGGVGLKAYSDSTKKVENKLTQLPEYPESEESRQEWWSRLQEWGEDPNYGAVTPDWDNIWNLTQQKIKEHYSGTALKTGVNDKLKASLARRNMSENPASDYLLMASGAEEGKQLQEAAVAEGVQKTNLAESGRKTWLQSLQSLTSMKPRFIQSQEVTGGIPWMDITGSMLQAGGTAALGYQANMSELGALTDTPGGISGTTPSSISGAMGKPNADLYDKQYWGIN